MPADQDRKIATIKSASKDLASALNAPTQQPAPSDHDLVAAIRATASDLTKAAGNASGPSSDSARRVADLLTRLAQSDVAIRGKAEAAVTTSLIVDLNQLRMSLDPQLVTLKTLPPGLVRAWLLPDGRARVQILPKGNLSDTGVLEKFATTLLKEPRRSKSDVDRLVQRRDKPAIRSPCDRRFWSMRTGQLTRAMQDRASIFHWKRLERL